MLKKILLSISTFICILLFSEYFAWLALKMTMPSGASDKRVRADCYSSFDTAQQIFADFSEIKTQFWPFGIWKNTKLQTETTNISSEGIRKSYITKIPITITIWAFGGSTMFGTGSSDLDTIPSELVKISESHGLGINIKNFGTSGYVHSQSRSRLFHELSILRKNKKPEIVVFLDGSNDIYAAFQNKYAGGIQNEREIIDLWNAGASFFSSILVPARLSSVWRLARGINNRFRAAKYRSDEKETELKRLSQEICDQYLSESLITQKTVESLGITCFCFWQPSIFSAKNLTNYEQQQKIAKRELYNLTRLTNKLIQNSNQKNVHYLGDIFQNHNEPIWIDMYHCGPSGNTIIAQAIFSELNLLHNKTYRAAPPASPK